jgi:hypothetical protein
VIPVFWGPDGVAVGVTQFTFIRDSVGYGAGLTYVADKQTVALPYYYKFNLTGAYPYRLEVQINTAEKKINITSLDVGGSDDWIYINVTYSGYLKLYLGDKLVAYDALYGWTIRKDQAPPSAGGSVSEPGGTCVTQKVIVKREGIVHTDLTNSTNGYLVNVRKRFVIHEFGCGVDRTYEETISAGVYTADGTSYHTRDPSGNVCGFKQARDCGGVVYCNKCPGEQSS